MTRIFPAALALILIASGALASDPTPAPAPSRQLAVYYFHGNVRCATCRRIESLTRAALAQGFAPEIASQSVELRVVNVDETENEHFVEDFQLFTRSVVLAMEENGIQTHWARLDRVWELVGDEGAFRSYLTEEISAQLASDTPEPSP